MSSASKTPNPDVPDASAVFADIQRRKRPVEERPPDLLSTRLKMGGILGVLAGLVYGIAEVYLSDARVETVWLNLALAMVGGLLVGVINAYPTSGIRGIGWSSLAYAVLLMLRTFVMKCTPLYTVWLQDVWVGLIWLGTVVGLVLAGLVPCMLLRWSVNEQREYFDKPWSSMERLRPILLLLVASGLVGWVVADTLSLMGMSCV